MSGLDWPGLMRAGLRDLRLPPDVFWALTPAELQLMLGRDPTDAPMSRDRLDALIRAFPDRPDPDRPDPDRTDKDMTHG